MKINETLQPGIVQPNRISGSRTPATPSSLSSVSESVVDRADLHPEVRIETQIIEGAKLVYEALPDVREDRVAQAKQRLTDGYYDRPEVIDQIAARLSADPEAVPAAPLSLERQAEIKRRLTEGFYDSPQVVDTIAAGLAGEV